MVEPGQLPDFLKDVASQGAMVYVLTQIVKDTLQRWLGELDAQATRGVALAFSVLVSAGVFSPIDPNWPRWVLTVLGYATVVILPVALTGHVVSRLGAPRPDIVAKRRAAKLLETEIKPRP